MIHESQLCNKLKRNTNEKKIMIQRQNMVIIKNIESKKNSMENVFKKKGKVYQNLFIYRCYC